jgi:Mrp family chromosome partitioning ATPase/uncharacterized protein involved in exopolysaccharide biosynthesis
MRNEGEIGLVGAGGSLLLSPMSEGGRMGPSRVQQGDPAAEVHTSAPLAIWNLLAGRRRLATVLIVLGIIAGTAVGIVLGKKSYRSTARIRIASVLPQVLYKDEEKNLVQTYEAFAEAQMQLLMSQRVAKAAVETKAWRDAGRPNNDEAMADLQGELTTERKLEMISVHVDDPTPQGAYAAVNSIIEAYQEIYRSDDRDNRQHRISLLEKHLESLTVDLDENRRRQWQVAGGTSPEDLQAEHDNRLRMVPVLEDVLRLANHENAVMANPAASGELPNGTQSPALNKRLRIQERISDLLSVGIGENHPLIAALKSLEADASKLTGGRTSESVAEELKRTQARVALLSGQLKQLADLRSDEEVIKQQKAECRRRMYQLRVEDEVNNRVILMAGGEIPTGPYRDTRKPFAAAGALTGGLLGLALAACLCLIDRRFRVPTDLALEPHHSAVLAMIPRLSPTLVDGDQARRAALAIHQMRMLLQARAGRESSVFAVTSAAPGAGKTSIALALGASAASAGLNTLLIDMDLTGAGLTVSVHAQRGQRLGRMLMNRGLLTERQISDAVAAKGAELKFGEVCVRLGMVTEADIASALDAQHRSRVGVLEAIAGRPLDECVAETAMPRLSVLPLGSAAADDAAGLSLAATRRLLEQARRKYDIVIVDTGPLFGSLEASIVPQAVDGTVLVVSRGEERGRAKRGKDVLQALGAPLAGVVFNRAEPQDLSPISFSSSAAPNPTSLRPERAGWERLAGFGPIARAVARYAPSDVESASRKSLACAAVS